MDVKLIVFDLAGTTVQDNQDVQRALQKAFAYFDVHITPAEINAEMGLPKPIAIKNLLKKNSIWHSPTNNDLIREIHQNFVHEMLRFYEEDSSVAEKYGVTETFRKLKDKKLKVALDTGFDRRITNTIIHRLGWCQQNLIDASVASDEVKRGRPFPDMIYRAMELTHVQDPKCVAKVGDTKSDLLEGNAAGCKWVIGVTTGTCTIEELREEIHTHLIQNVDELLEILT
jgi:phosphonatase-like hydrolase